MRDAPARRLDNMVRHVRVRVAAGRDGALRQPSGSHRDDAAGRGTGLVPTQILLRGVSPHADRDRAVRRGAARRKRELRHVPRSAPCLPPVRDRFARRPLRLVLVDPALISGSPALPIRCARAPIDGATYLLQRRVIASLEHGHAVTPTTIVRLLERLARQAAHHASTAQAAHVTEPAARRPRSGDPPEPPLG